MRPRSETWCGIGLALGGGGPSVPGNVPPMSAPQRDQARAKAAEAARRQREGFPSDAELLHELRLHGAKPPPREIPRVSRRTRDFTLLAVAGSVTIALVVFHVVGSGAVANAVKLTLTGIGVFCALLWFIFFGVMSRY